MTTPPARLAALDGLRFAAAAAVVLYHLTARTSSAWGPGQADALGGAGRWTSYGSLGPELFFVVSGFVVLMSAWGRPTVHVVASRVARLYPAYWVAVLMTGGLLLVLWPEGKQVSAHQVLVNLTMVQSSLGVDHVDGVYWTLWTELRFYLLIGLFSLVGVTRRRVLAVVVLWPVAALVVERAGWDALATALVSDYASLFAAGMALYLAFRPADDGPRLGVATWCAVVGNTLLAVWRVVPSRSEVLARTTGYEPSVLLLGVGVVVCVAAVAVVTLTPLARVDSRRLTAAGALTYPLYLVHEYWGLYVVRLTSSWAPAAVSVAAAAAVALALAWLVHRGVERPLGPRLRAATEAGLVRARAVVLEPLTRGPRLLGLHG
ncbi:acyltransferase [Cellulomonas sp.]|uniref:acyltransferase family protein n=1 Tax=Cellulomonas sp. TaxID=40001 RepID=UPI001B265731|nr:acyltransferase [Cellulomonas sp.]MBO9555395.1 acyltransferase [Cellulomonas sp.]